MLQEKPGSLIKSVIEHEATFSTEKMSPKKKYNIYIYISSIVQVSRDTKKLIPYTTITFDLTQQI